VIIIDSEYFIKIISIENETKSVRLSEYFRAQLYQAEAAM
jgi:hypothetical protein